MSGETSDAEHAVERLLRRKLTLLGHGTTETSASTVFKDGLCMAVPDLGSTFDLLPSGSNRQRAKELFFDQIASWRHEDRGDCIVIVGVQHPAEPVARRYVHAIIQSRTDVRHPMPRGEAGVEHFVPPNFVAGYFRRREGDFVINPGFDPQFDVRLIETTSELRFERDRRFVDEMRLEAQGRQEGGAIPVVPQASPDFGMW